MDDDCRAIKVAEGFLPERARFRPQTRHRLPQNQGARPQVSLSAGFRRLHN
jgi:hypothetical protein